jgi:AAA15 family ATPase/GTPase
MGAEDVYLIIGNFKSLAKWNLIPLRALSIFLGPNSAGKSAVYDAIQIFKLLKSHGSLSNKERYALHGVLFKAKRKNEDDPLIGISFPYSFDQKKIKNWIDQAEKYKEDSYANSGYISPVDFPLLSDLRIKESVQSQLLINSRYTFLIETLEMDYFNFRCYMGQKEVATFWGTRTLKTAEINRDLFKKLKPKSIFLKDYLKDPERNFAYNIDNRDSSDEFSTPDLFKCPTNLYPLNLPSEKVAREHFDTAFSFHSLFFNFPLDYFFKNFKFDKTDDVRELSSEWMSPVSRSLNSVPQDFKTSKYCPSGLFVSYVLDLIDDKDKRNYLEKVNYWLTHGSFMDTGYHLKIDVQFLISSNEFMEGFSQKDLKPRIKYYIKTHEFPIDFFAKLTLIDHQNRSLKFDEVGSGFSQMVPILVSLSQDELLMYKQPEIHLHPKLQSRIADCFVQVINESKSVKRPKIRLVETHSEHFVLRLLRRLRESYQDNLWHSSLTLYPSDIAILYFQPSNHGTQIYQIRVDKSGGFIDKWPDGFFDERDEDLL